jgi:predicted ATPase/DNA-binding NarL/FixJ family response regulator
MIFAPRAFDDEQSRGRPAHRHSRSPAMADQPPAIGTVDQSIPDGNMAAARPPRLRSTLVGREPELALIDRMLAGEEVSLLTLTGPGGVGKTRLAVEAGNRAAAHFPDGVVYVSLDATLQPGLVCKAVCDALELGNPGAGTPFDLMISYLRNKQMLLILDSFEHLLDAGPSVVRMLEECQQAKVLVTSQTRLQLSLEHDLIVQPLNAPAAVELFVARARAANPSFTLDAGNAGDVAAICQRLDGLPLALELAAARVRMLSPQALRARLEPALDLLTTGARDQPNRHRTMRSAIAWSYDLLDPIEQQLLRRFSVFEQGFRLDLAAKVTPDLNVLDGVTALVDASLLHKTDVAADAEPCFKMLEVVREFGAERLAESDEAEDIHRRHAQAMREFVRANYERVWTSDGPLILARFDLELPNIRAAMRWAGAAGEIDLELEIASAMVNYWVVRGHYVEGTALMWEAIERAGAHPSAELARLYSGIGWLASLLGDYERAMETGKQGLELARAHGHLLYEGQSLQLLALAEGDRDDYAAALGWASQALEVYRRVEDQVVAGSQYVSSILSTMGGLALSMGDPALASLYLEEELLRQRGWGFTWRLGETLRYLGDVALARGDVDAALARYKESVELAREHGDRLFLAGALVAIAIVESERGNAVRSVRLLGAADALSQQVGFAPDRWERVRYEVMLAKLQDALPNGAFGAAWEDGAALSFDDLLTEALADAEPHPERVLELVIDGPVPLTAREQAVLALLTEGRSDREIGEALNISPRTVSGHVTNLLAKLDVPSRTAAAAYAIRRS